MILDPLTAAASDNLRHTYFELGRSSTNSHVWSERGFDACTGDVEHPICNFAAGLDLDAQSARRLARVAVDRSVFNVYATPADRPRDLGILLASEGFTRTYRLLQMIAEPAPRDPRSTLARASTLHDRHQIALFMADQFFSKQGRRFRTQVAEATSRATSLELLSLRRDGKIIGGAMVSFKNGIAGVYNVCVDSGVRGLGIGSSILQEILSVCALRNVPATLQCDPKLEHWYRSLGFLPTGEIDVYALAKANGFAII